MNININKQVNNRFLMIKQLLILYLRLNNIFLEIYLLKPKLNNIDLVLNIIFKLT